MWQRSIYSWRGLNRNLSLTFFFFFLFARQSCRCMMPLEVPVIVRASWAGCNCVCWCRAAQLSRTDAILMFECTQTFQTQTKFGRAAKFQIRLERLAIEIVWAAAMDFKQTVCHRPFIWIRGGLWLKVKQWDLRNYRRSSFGCQAIAFTRLSFRVAWCQLSASMRVCSCCRSDWNAAAGILTRPENMIMNAGEAREHFNSGHREALITYFRLLAANWTGPSDELNRIQHNSVASVGHVCIASDHFFPRV